MSEAEESRRRKVVDRAIGMAVAVIVGGCDTTLSEARAALLEGMDAVPRAHVHNALIADELADIVPEKAEAEVVRLRELVEEFLEVHPSGEHYWHASPEGGSAGWCKECSAEWPCLVERARTALYAEEGSH